MNEDAEKLKTKIQEFLKTLPKEKLDKFRQDAEIINYFVNSEQHLKREPLSIQYKNTKTGDVCLFENACHIKIGDNWVNGVAYFNANKLREMFVITEDEFFNSFEEIIDEVEI